MKKIISILCALFLLTGCVAHAAEYRYFSSAEMSVQVDTSSMAVLNGCTYATDAKGTLYGTHVFSDWLPMEYAPKNCRIISTNLKTDDKLLLFSENTLYVTYDGYAYTPVETFTAGSVVQYINGLYTAMSMTDAGYHLRYSFDAMTWYDFQETLTASTFSVLHVNEGFFLLKNMNAKSGTMDVFLSSATPESYLASPYLTYDYEKNIFPDVAANSELIYATKTTENQFLYVLRTDYSYTLVRLNADRTLHSQSTLVADSTFDLYVLNNTVCLAKNGQSLNLINIGDAKWHQVNNDIAFPLLKNAHGLCGDVFFDGGYTSTYYYQNTETLPTATSGIEVTLNGNYLAFDSAPQLMNDRTMVPMRTIAEALLCTVSYDAATQGIHIQRSDGASLQMTVGQDSATFTWADGVSAPMQLDVPPVIVDGRTLVPLRFISEALNVTVEWNTETQTVVLN